MQITIRPDIWVKVAEDRRVSDGRIYQAGQAGWGSIHASSWLEHFCHGHHDVQIAWPDDAWLDWNENLGQLIKVAVRINRYPWGRIRARARAEGLSAPYVLRRLLSQHFGLRPERPCRVTGGPHVRIREELRRCPTCSDLQTLPAEGPTATPLPYPFAGSTENRDIPVMPWVRDKR